MNYTITVDAQKTMFGKRTGSILARLESDWSANVMSAAGPTISAAKQALINHLGRLASNDERAYIFCEDSTVLVVSFAGENWQYDIIGPDRSRSGCITNASNFREAKESAISHANTSYGGVHSIS